MHDDPATLGSRLRGHDNAFGFLRLTLAVLVLVSHAFPLGGFGADPIVGHGAVPVTLGTAAVIGFFAISGYLIATSAQRTDVLQFMWRRVLRLFPGYWVMLVVTAVVVGPYIWHRAGHPAGAYWTTADQGPLTFITHNWTLLVGQYGLHNLLAPTPYGAVFNGSIWTLVYEWRAYLLIAVLLATNVLRKAPALVAAITGGFAVLALVHASVPAVLGLYPSWLADPYTIELTLPFMVGATLACYADRIPFDDRLGIGSGLAIALTLAYGAFLPIGAPLGVYFVLWLAVRLPAPLRRVGARNDYSYGIYIYGFMVQQVLAYKGGERFGYLPYLAGSLIGAAACGWLSWHLIEKQALKLKSWGPGLGLTRLQAGLMARVAGVRSRRPLPLHAVGQSPPHRSGPRPSGPRPSGPRPSEPVEESIDGVAAVI